MNECKNNVMRNGTINLKVTNYSLGVYVITSNDDTSLLYFEIDTLMNKIK